MAERLKITELDFDTIKQNLKTFLKNQKQFQDYDFEGSGLNILLDVLAYNTHYNAYYLNMLANESFLDTALLRDSVISHAKTLGYTPYSKKASRAVVSMTVPDTGITGSVLTLPRGFSFRSQIVDGGTSYNFVLLNDAQTEKFNNSFFFDALDIYEGSLVDYSFAYDEDTNPRAVFTLQDKNIDTSSIKVSVRDGENSSTFVETFTKVNDVLDVTDTSSVFFLQESRGQYFQIYFGDGVVGRKLLNGATIYVNYLVTSGPSANKLDSFTPISNYPSANLNTLSASAGGSERQTVDDIKFTAIAQFPAQNRLVTTKDYESFIKQNFPSINSLTVWGGEEEIPPVFGKIFLSVNTKDNYYLSETDKEMIVDDYIKPRSMVSIKTEFRDPDYLYLKLKNRVKYDKRKTTLTPDSLRENIRDAIVTYKDQYLNTFGATFIVSKMQDFIDDAEKNSILGSETSIRLEKRFEPILNEIRNYNLSFKTQLLRGTLINRLVSSEFQTYDEYGIERTAVFEEVPESSTGISRIDIVNPGYLYTRTPTVTITGDGTGATAEAVVVNGKVESIVITNRGTNYTKAKVTITGGDGYGAEAGAVLDSRFGDIRTIYFNEDEQRQIINSKAGTIDYITGEVNIFNLRILAVNTTDGLFRVNVQSLEGIINSERNTIITIDEDDPGSIDVELVE